MTFPLCFLRGALNRRDDLVVGAAATDVALHVLDDLLARGFLVLGEQRRRGHDLAGLTVAALRRLLLHPGFLQRVITVRRQALDGGDLLSRDRGDRRDARANGIAVDVNGAGAALRDAAAELRAGQAEV